MKNGIYMYVHTYIYNTNTNLKRDNVALLILDKRFQDKKYYQI